MFLSSMEGRVLVKRLDFLLCLKGTHYFSFLYSTQNFSVLLWCPLFREIWKRAITSRRNPPDIHIKLMYKYEDIPQWWFYTLLVPTLSISFALCEFYKEQVQLPWWGLILACAFASLFNLSISVITTTTNKVKLEHFDEK